MTAVFLDSNILVYAYSADDRSIAALELLARPYVIGVQTLNEFSHVAYRKLKMPLPSVTRSSMGFAARAQMILQTELADHQQSLLIADRHHLSIYDALMLAIALRAGCTTFYSEDMHHGLVLDDRLRILNPFA